MMNAARITNVCATEAHTTTHMLFCGQLHKHVTKRCTKIPMTSARCIDKKSRRRLHRTSRTFLTKSWTMISQTSAQNFCDEKHELCTNSCTQTWPSYPARRHHGNLHDSFEDICPNMLPCTYHTHSGGKKTKLPPRIWHEHLHEHLMGLRTTKQTKLNWRS